MEMPPQNLVTLGNLPFEETTLREMIHSSVSSVFSTMMSKEVTSVDPTTVEEDDKAAAPLSYFDADHSLIVGMVGFLGTVSGMMYLYIEEQLARTLCGAFLGMTQEEIAAEGFETINDTLGEICNMTMGSFKQQLCTTGLDCRLTIPSIIRGSHFSIETSADVARRAYPFSTDGSVFVVDVLLKVEE